MTLNELKEEAYDSVRRLWVDITYDMEQILNDKEGTQDLDFEDVSWAYRVAMEKLTEDLVNKYQELDAEKEVTQG